MYFCPNCNNVFDITKSSSQAGGGYISSEESELTTTSDSFNMVGSGPESDYDNIIKKVLHDEEIKSNDLDKISLDDLIKTTAYKKLNSKQREFVYNHIQDLMPLEKKKIIKEDIGSQSSEKAYFICKNCGYMKPIEDGTLIFSRVSSDIAQSYTTNDYKDMAFSDIIPRTRKYLCTNEKCISHKDNLKREAVYFRLNNSFKVKYICLACGTSI